MIDLGHLWLQGRRWRYRWLFRLHHQAFDLSEIVGLRDRLRCPECRAVGTWKPHGGWLDRGSRESGRRWLCKWCGLYIGIPLLGEAPCDRTGDIIIRQAWIGKHSWELWSDARHLEHPFKSSPQKALAGVSGYESANPWIG